MSKYTMFEPTATDKEDIGVSSTKKLKKNFGTVPGLDRETLYAKFIEAETEVEAAAIEAEIAVNA